MKKLIITIAVAALMSLAAFAQTPTPPARPAAAPAAAAAAPAGGTGVEGKVAILNTGAFRQGVTELKAKLDALNAEFEPKKKELESLQGQIEAIKNKINTQGNTVSAAVRNGWVEEGTELEKTLKRKDEDYNALGQKRLQEASGPVYDRISLFLQDYCKQKSIVMVIEGGAAQQAGVLLFAHAATDITDDFMKAFNAAPPAKK